MEILFQEAREIFFQKNSGAGQEGVEDSPDCLAVAD
jgi:hypothetical protein